MRVAWIQRLTISVCLMLLVLHRNPTTISAITSWTSDPKTSFILAQYHYWTGREEIFEVLASNWQPVFPFYDTGNSSTTERHITWASQNNLDGFVVPWNGQDSMSDNHLRQGLLRSDNIHLLRFCLSLTDLTSWSAGMFSADSSDTRPRPFMRSLMYIRREYMSHASYLSFGKRPVLVVDFHPSSVPVSKRIASAVRESISDVFLIGDVCAVGNDWDEDFFVEFAASNKHQYDAFYCSRVISSTKAKGKTQLSDVFSNKVLPAFRRWTQMSSFIPTVVPFYKDFQGPVKRLLKSDPRDFANEILAVRELPRLKTGVTDVSLIVVQSFNDWILSTALEPSRRIGYDYLNVLRSFSK